MSQHMWLVIILAVIAGYVAARYFPQPAALIGLP